VRRARGGKKSFRSHPSEKLRNGGGEYPSGSNNRIFLSLGELDRNVGKLGQNLVKRPKGRHLAKTVNLPNLKSNRKIGKVIERLLQSHFFERHCSRTCRGGGVDQ